METIDTKSDEEFLSILKQNSNRRRIFIDKLLAICEPSDLMHLSSRIDDYKRDFLSLLPIETVEAILAYLDWKTLLSCCQVETLLKQFLQL